MLNPPGDDFLGLGNSGHEEVAANGIDIERVDKLSDLNVEQELLDRYYDCRVLLLSSKAEKDRVLTMNSLMAVMRMIVSMKTELYNMERMKKCESAIIEILQEWPEVRDAFLAKYGEKLSELG